MTKITKKKKKIQLNLEGKEMEMVNIQVQKMRTQFSTKPPQATKQQYAKEKINKQSIHMPEVLSPFTRKQDDDRANHQ